MTTARATVAAIAAGATSARAECEAAIARIETLDGSINAVVVRDFDRARVAADAADARLAAGKRACLLGLPMTVKESFDIAGLPTTWGFAEHTDHVATRDAVVVARLKRAGAVILGKTNVPVALADWQTVNPNYGRTDNPRAPGRSAGGSSGGSAAALAAGMVALEYGSDIGGSIRVPAHFCGVWGHKPTHGVVPLSGHFMPRTDGARGVLGVAGPLATDPEDLELALLLTANHPLEAAKHTSLQRLRILVLDHHPVAAISSDVGDVLAATAAACERGGAVLVTDTALPDLEAMHGEYVRLLMTTLSRGAGRGDTVTPLATWLDMLDTQARYARHWATLFERVDVVLAPVAGIVAFPHDDMAMGGRTVDIDGTQSPFAPQLAFAGLANYTDLPATAFPAGTTPSGLPVGLQVIAAKYADRAAIAAARAIVQALSTPTPF